MRVLRSDKKGQNWQKKKKNGGAGRKRRKQLLWSALSTVWLEVMTIDSSFFLPHPCQTSLIYAVSSEFS